jgi:hypothetical protein
VQHQGAATGPTANACERIDANTPPALMTAIDYIASSSHRGDHGSPDLRQRWPDFGRTTALNAAAQCASMISIPPRQRLYEPVGDVAADLYGSDGRTTRLGAAGDVLSVKARLAGWLTLKRQTQPLSLQFASHPGRRDVDVRQREREASSDRGTLITAALRLVVLSVVFGLASGVISVVTGLGQHSLSVLAIGLGVLADVSGSAFLIWRFQAEQIRPAQAEVQEARAAVVVATALAMVSIVLAAESLTALASCTRPGTSDITLIAAGISLAILAPLAYAKRRLGRRMDSRALQGDGTLSAIGAATSLLALAALALNNTLSWWWADRVVALAIALIAAVEAWHTTPRRHPGRS